MYKIGLTGGIGSGKSTVLNWLKEKNISCIDADIIAREVVAPESQGLLALKEKFGDVIIGNDGALNRQALSDIVFNDDKKLHLLNSLLHGEIRKRIEEQTCALEKRGVTTVVYDVPLLIEVGWHTDMDEIWLVYADHQSRLNRLALRNGYDQEESERRIAGQMPLDDKRKYADVILDNSGTLSDLVRQLQILWKKKKSLFGRE